MDMVNIEAVNDYYDRIMFGRNTLQNKIGFLNVGYWKGVNDSMEVAQINLIETLTKFFSRTDGNVLDVACGKGASSKFLTKYFLPRNITGINISDRQLDACKVWAEECRFIRMDATQLEFPDLSYDNILCIEAAFHFATRERFFCEAHRVLTKGGRLAMSDILFGKEAAKSFPWIIEENYLPNVESYRDRLLAAGFEYVRVEDSTEFATSAAFRVVAERLEHDFDDLDLRRDYQDMLKFAAAQPICCMVYAIK
jgi:ubiquinone/menaquinone biosynthesis C-methylase UbiE